MKRVPNWVVILAFAILVGSAIAVIALVRMRMQETECTSRFPALPEYTRTIDTAPCRAEYTRDGKTVLVVLRTEEPFRTRLVALERKLQLPADQIASRRALIETTVQATAATLIGLVGDGDAVIELHFDPAVFDRERALAIVRGL